MNTLNRFLQHLNGRQDIALAVVLIMAVFMIILPLPTLLVDALIALNLTVSLLLLMIAVYVHEPLEFSAFPSVLLITTLYRLSLSISTTRLILMQHDAGEIVYTFGNFVVGGNIGIGMIIFAIITIVQFIVITKGSERVAEVGARFSLDGMPGKQMSIDGDMRAGIIDAAEAKRLRSLVQKESQLYGAMDGAMKFVKGDAIASIIIILVNIFGGVGVGMFVHHMSAGEALQTYAVLSIGDGLIAQIPALLISITAGIIVTRVPGEKRQNLGTDLSEQMARQPKPLFLAAAMLLLFALLPGFPTLIFLTLALVMAGGGWMLTRKGRHSPNSQIMGDNEDEQSLSPGSVPLVLQLPAQLHSPSLMKHLTAMRWRLFNQTGVIIPEIVVHNRPDGAPLIVEIYQEPVLTLSLSASDLLSTGCHTDDPLAQRLHTGKYLQIVASSATDRVKDDDLLEGDARILYCLETLIRFHAKEFIGVQETRVLMDGLGQDYGELVKEVQRQMPLAKITEVLQRLVEEGISIRDLRTICEALLLWAPKEKDVVIVVEYVRTALRRHIVHRYHNPEKGLQVWLVGSALENLVRESIRQTSSGAYSALDGDQINLIVEEVRKATAGATHGVLLTAIDVRRYLRRLIEREFWDLSVLSFQEIGDDAPLHVLGNIELIGQTS
ncbi:type III secretion system export apparatus subunit SctV [Ewingella americana]|uniref:type III secretion system export apparatus subunit SctV n=1 Tax=Ewingella americana TaxID=41202 RepID=UPI0012AD209F|nr:type III secretion system export apparatus subunit SctV [Ewingella americana]MRT05914.1 EscV/YscV/HrcV family type III secretion system export apparatus protein [Ewingella americana]